MKYAISSLRRVSGEENKTKSLNLSSFNIPEAQCSILGKILTHDFIFTSIHLNDCNLSTEGNVWPCASHWSLLFDSLTSVAPWTRHQHDVQNAGIEGNAVVLTFVSIVLMTVKGNGIQGAGTEALAKVLRRNQTLRK